MKNEINRISKKSGLIAKARYVGGVALGVFLFHVARAQEGGLVNSPKVKCSGPECGFDNLVQLMLEFIKWIINLGLIAVAGIFAYAGWLYLTAQGNPGKIKKAHSVFVKVFVGAIMATSAFVIIGMILKAFGVTENVLEVLPF